MPPKAHEIYDICALKQRMSSISTRIYRYVEGWAGQFADVIHQMWDDCQFAENCYIYVNNRKYGSKSGFPQNRGFEENAATDRTFVDHNYLNERVYPYVYDRNVRFSSVAHKM